MPKAARKPRASKRPTGRPRAITPQVAAEISERIAQGRTLKAVCRDSDMPALPTVYKELHRSPGFGELIARARQESAHGLAMEVLDVATEAVENPKDKPHWGQLVRNQCDQLRWLAGKYNALYSDKIAVTDADGGSIAARLSKMSAEERSAWAAEVAAQARSLLGPPTIENEGDVD